MVFACLLVVCCIDGVTCACWCFLGGYRWGVLAALLDRGTLKAGGIGTDKQVVEDEEAADDACFASFVQVGLGVCSGMSCVWRSLDRDRTRGWLVCPIYDDQHVVDIYNTHTHTHTLSL